MSGLTSKAIIVGASGGIARALVANLVHTQQFHVISVSRSSDSVGGDTHFHSDYSETSIRDVAQKVNALPGEIARLIICNGVLHGESFQPERALKRLSGSAMTHVLQTNTVTPILWLSAFMDAIKQASAPRIAVFSARVGSLADNRLGGWYSYRASKAALNMALKCAAIELARLNPQAKVIAFHPGTTDTDMSKPFQKGVPAEKLFTPAFVAQRLTDLLDTLEPDGELTFLDWDTKPIAW